MPPSDQRGRCDCCGEFLGPEHRPAREHREMRDALERVMLAHGMFDDVVCPNTAPTFWVCVARRVLAADREVGTVRVVTMGRVFWAVLLILSVSGVVWSGGNVRAEQDRLKSEARQGCEAVLEDKGWDYFWFRKIHIETTVTCQGVQDGVQLHVTQAEIEALIGPVGAVSFWTIFVRVGLLAGMAIVSLVGLLYYSALEPH